MPGLRVLPSTPLPSCPSFAFYLSVPCPQNVTSVQVISMRAGFVYSFIRLFVNFMLTIP
jgi:hypothetical protein